MLLNSGLGRRRVHEIAIDGTRQRVSLTEFKKIRFPKPSKKEQDSIATIICCWDRSIDLTERLIAAKQERRTWLMQQLLTGKRRLPGFDGKWPEVYIRDIFKPVRRKNDKGVTHVLTASGEHGLVDQTEYFNRSVSGESLDGYYLLRRGEFAYNRSSMNGYPYGAIKRLDAYDEGVLSTLYLCFKISSENCHSDFYKHLFEAGVLNIQLRKIVQVGARAHGLLNVTLHDFFSLKVSYPPIDEQKRIAETIDVADRELDLLRAQLDGLREQKKGLMQQLLTGKIRVKV
jgi:type I restriction enzyme S subunit